MNLQHCHGFKTPASAQYAERCHTLKELEQALLWADAKDIPVHVLGGGTNTLMPEHFDGLVVMPKLMGLEFAKVAADQWAVTASAGEDWHTLVEKTVQWLELQGAATTGGLENLALIPGTVGASVIQNIGAYGREVSSFIQAVDTVQVVDGQLVHRTREPAELELGYRTSMFKRAHVSTTAKHVSPEVITQVTFSFDRARPLEYSYPALTESAVARQIFEQVVAIRQQRLPDPEIHPNLGSFFHNITVDSEQIANLLRVDADIPHWQQPDGSIRVSSAYMIDQAVDENDRYYQNAGISTQHALVMVAKPGATYTQILALTKRVQERVHSVYGYTLQVEPTIVKSIAQ